MIEFTAGDFDFWSDFAFNPDYPGCRKAGFEQPDSGQGSGYEYSHIAHKYLGQESVGYSNHARTILGQMVDKSRLTAMEYGIGPDFLPTVEDSTLRLLRYPPNTASAKHTDFCLMTFPLWRSDWSYYHHSSTAIEKYGIHYGEIMEQLQAGRKATPHWVDASPVWQYSAVFFAMPSLAAVLPNGQTVGEWVASRKEETRYE